MSIIIPANSAVGGGYDVDNSVRFNGGSSDDLTGTPSGTPTSRYKGTLSVWLKRSAIDEEDFIFYGLEGSANRMKITFLANNKLQINTIQAGSNNLVYETNRLFRDVSAWYHIVIAIDTTLGTAGDRCRLYVNGVEETSFSTETDFSQNAITFMSETNIPVYIGSQSTGNYYDGYMAEYVLIDGQQLAPTSFGEFDEDSGIWKPIDVSGLTFGTNGFYLDFKNSGSLGADVSGNSNNFTARNLTAIDQSTDTCTNNFCTPNSLYPPSNGSVVFSEGNLKTVFSTYSQSPNGTLGAGAGKWYYEMKMSTTHARFGWCESHCPQGDTDSDSTFPAYAIYSNGSNGLSVYKNVTARGITLNTGYTSWSAGDTVGIAFDIDNGKFYAHLNGTYYNSGDPVNGTGALITGITAQEGGLFLPYLNCGTASAKTFEWNFGSPSFAISSGNADGNGYGNFEYAVPSGYFSLNTKNLAEYG